MPTIHPQSTHRPVVGHGLRTCPLETAFERHLRRPTRRTIDYWSATLGGTLYAELQDLASILGRWPTLHRGSDTALILPGFMGSTLGPAGEPSVWFNPMAIATGQLGALRLPESAHYVAAGVLPFVYLRLRWRLRAAGYRVHYWPFDWRLSPTSNAARLIQELAAAGGAPVHLVAHSQGGLVAAHALAEDRNAQWLARVVTLGTPFLGAYAAQQALEGEAPLLQRLAWLDPHHTAKDLARSPLATWPGLQTLLPIASDASSYSVNADPRLGCLAATGRNTTVLNAAGQLEATDAGDGTVAVASALAPTLALASSLSTGSAASASVTLPVGRGSHGTLPAMPAIAQQVTQFLQHGAFAPPREAETVAPRQAAPVVACTYGWEAMEREAQWRFLAEWAAPIDGAAPDLQPTPAPRWDVHCGLPRRSRAEVVLVGLFRHVGAAGLLGALGMQAAAGRAIAHGRFIPDLGATLRLHGRHGCPDVVLCGLGDFDRLDAARLTEATAVAMQVAFGGVNQRVAMGLMGTTAGISPEVALAAQRAGVRLACARGQVLFEPQVVWLSSETRRANWLRKQLGLPRANHPAPANRTPPSTLPDYLLVRQEQEGRRTVLRVTLLPGRSKAVLLAGMRVLDAKAQAKVFAPLADGAGAAGVDAAGKALAALLPTEIVAALTPVSESPLVIVHDTAASRWPWETLQLGNPPNRPALTGGMARHLEATGLDMARWQADRPMPAALNILLIMNPTQDLAGADSEGHQLQALWAADERVRLAVLAGKEATRSRVLAALRSGRFDLVHYAGHAMFDDIDPAQSGLLCARREVLRGADLATLTSPPFLMLANACESGRVRGVPRKQRQAALSAGLAEAFLRAGIAHYLGTWWPVADSAAATFATCFHRSLLEGANCGGALLAARAALRQQGSGDWADYLHYGDPTAELFRAYQPRVWNLNSARQPSRTEIPRLSKVQVSP